MIQQTTKHAEVFIVYVIATENSLFIVIVSYIKKRLLMLTYEQILLRKIVLYAFFLFSYPFSYRLQIQNFISDRNIP